MSEQDKRPQGEEPMPEQEQAQSPQPDTAESEQKPGEPLAHSDKAQEPPRQKPKHKDIAIESQPARSKGGLVIGTLLTLVIALLIAAGVGAYYWLWPSYQSEQQAQMAQIEQLANQVRQDLNTAQSQNQELLQRAARQTKSLSLFQAQLSELEAAQRQLRQLNQSPPEQWVLAEADYLIRLAGQRLWIESDVATSLALLMSADERIASLHDASLVPLRRALNRDIQALRSLPKLDIEGITLALDGLIAQVETLPVKSLEIPDAIGTKAPQEISENPADWQQNLLIAWDTFIDGFIKVEHRVSDVAPLLSPEQSWFLSHNTKLMLQQAQLAALRSQPKHFHNSLQQAARWLTQYFKPESAAVQQAQLLIAELSIKPIELTLPEQLESSRLITEALSQPRQVTPPPPAITSKTEPSSEPAQTVSEEPAL